MANKSGGGVAVYVKDSFKVHEKWYVYNVADLKFVALNVVARVSALIAAVYRSDYSVSTFLSNLGSLLNSLNLMDCHPVICGNFNENFFSNVRKPILELFRSRGYTQLMTATTEQNTLLDLIFFSRPQHCLTPVC